MSSLASAWMSLGLVISSSGKTALDLDTLMQNFQKLPGLEASYTEKRTITLLTKPIHSSGRIYFQQPNSLLRVVETPHPSRVLIQGSRLFLGPEGALKEVPSIDNPAVQALINSFVLLLRGDKAALEELFVLSLRREPDSTWLLSLVPKTKDVRGLIQKIEVRGKGLALSTLHVQEASGDHAETRFTKLNLQRVY